MKGFVGLQLNERKSDSAGGDLVIPLQQIKAHSSYTVETQHYRWGVNVFKSGTIVTRLGLCDRVARQQCNTSNFDSHTLLTAIPIKHTTHCITN